MSHDRRAELARLADSVADGVPVDWNELEARAGQDERRLISHLRLVDSIASVYRGLPAQPEEGAAATLAGERWGRLAIIERIGRGTSSEVYRAFDTDLHREVALKLLHEGLAQQGHSHARLLEEARRLARIRHPHVVQIYGAERQAGRVGLWMELVEGESLDRSVRARGPFGAKEAALIGQDVCSALAAVHAARLLHRDVKAQNVIREAGGRIVLMDFGTGEELRSDAGVARLVGTPIYAAPEIFEGQPAAVPSDVYSVGVLLFYLVTGEFPVVAATLAELTAAHRAGLVRRLRDVRPDLPAAFVRVVERALERVPAMRYRSAGEMEAALRHSSTEVPPRFPGRPRAVAMIGGVAILVAGAALWSRGSLPFAAAPPSIRRIAVLPLVDVSSPPAPVLADALTDELITALGAIGSIRVTAPASVLRYKGRDVPVSVIARELGVDAVVQGTVKTDPPTPNAPTHALVTARLITAGGTVPLWSHAFDWVAGDVGSLQVGIAREVGRAIKAVVTPEESGRLAAHRRTTDPGAEEAYLNGRLHLASYGADAGRRALECFQRAIRLDRDFAAAYAGAARAYVRLAMNGTMSQTDARQAAASAARAAIRIDGDLAEAHAALGNIAFLYDWDFEEAEREYKISLDLNRSFSSARMYYAELLTTEHRFDEALTQASMARTLDPQSAEVKRRQTEILYYQRDYAAASATIEEASADEPGAAGVYIWKGRLAEAQARYQDALELTEQAIRFSNGGGVPLQIQRLRLLDLAGHHEAAQDGLRQLERQAETRAILISARDRAYLRLALGDLDEACALFQQARDEGEPSLVWLFVDPRVDSLRATPKFQAILKSIGPH